MGGQGRNKTCTGRLTMRLTRTIPPQVAVRYVDVTRAAKGELPRGARVLASFHDTETGGLTIVYAPPASHILPDTIPTDPTGGNHG